MNGTEEARMSPDAPLGSHGSTLVALDDPRAARAAVLVLQEMGLTVDMARDRDVALEWAAQAYYAVVVCGGSDPERITEFVIRLRYEAPQTRVILLAEPVLMPSGLEELGVEVLTAPVDVNRLVERLWPAAA